MRMIGEAVRDRLQLRVMNMCDAHRKIKAPKGRTSLAQHGSAGVRAGSDASPGGTTDLLRTH